MSFNSCKNLGSDMTLGNVVAKTITCDSITILDTDDENLAVETITATTGNIETLTSQTGNISNLQSDEITCPVFHCPNEYDSENISNPKCTNGITIGTKDGNGYNYQDVNLQINSWNSSGFVDTDNKICNLTIDHRNGNLQTKGNISGNSGNFDVINVATLNVSNPDDPTIPTDLNVSSITATTGNIENLTTDAITSSSITITSSVACNSLTSQSATSDYITANEKLLVSNNALILNNCLTDSTTALLGNSGETVGDYLTALYPGSTSSYALEQLAAGDNGSQSIILTAGGSFGDDTNSIQSYDTNRTEQLDLRLNPLGGKVITDNLTFTNNNKPVQAKPLTSSAMPNMEVLFYHLQGSGDDDITTMTLANNINGTTNYAVFPSIYLGSNSSSVWDNFFNIVVSNITETQFTANLKNVNSYESFNVYIQFLVIYDMVGTDFPKSY